MKKLFLMTALLAMGAILLVMCKPETVVEEVVVTRLQEREVEVTRITGGETVVETVIETVVETVVETVEVPAESVVTLDLHSSVDIPSLDPQLAEDTVSIEFIENLFVHLTNYELATAEVVPEAATSWEISADGLVYTFHIRTDIPWVRYDPRSGNVVQEIDDQGIPRFVTAHDFVYGIKRACDPKTGSYYGSIVAPLIVGCSNVFFAEDPTQISEEELESIGVSAPDKGTLVVELEFPAAYFLSMTTLWTLAATPEWAIAQYGEEWSQMGNIVTNGRYALAEWVHNVRSRLVRNPFTPLDLRGSGNIDQVVISILHDQATVYDLWLNNEVDTARIPDAELQAHLERFPDETDQIPGLAVFYYGFRMTKPPVDNVHVRRALSAAFDRETYARDVMQGQALPMIHFAPPGIFGAPPIDEVGISFDPDLARAELAAAGYPDCQGFPGVTLLGYSSQENLEGLQFAQASWAEALGCDPALFQIEQAPFRELLAAIAADMPDEKAPHMWTLGWAPDYADENNWVGDVLWCENPYNPHKRVCNEVDDLIVQAREEQDPERRVALYRQIEEMLFGPEGEIPFVPQSVGTGYVARHAWLDRVPALFGGAQWYNWTIDWEAKTAARGE
jgi:oligopeptide transport system substrate-binding protein